jgi:hypothetical protein
MMTASATGDVPLAAPWLIRAFNELQRKRHLVVHGNIDDLIRWDREYRPMHEVLAQFLSLNGFEVIGRFSLADGLTYHDETSRQFAATAAHPPGRAAPEREQRGGSPRADRADASSRTLREALFQRQPPEARGTTEALTLIRRLMVQQIMPSAIVVEAADLILGAEGQLDESYPTNVAHVRRLLEDAGEVRLAGDKSLRNALVFISREIGALPAWLRDSPNVATVLAELPGPAERTDLLERQVARFHAAADLPGDELKRSVQVLAGITDGMTVRDIQAIEVTSRIAGIGAAAPRRLVARHRFGLRDDPWEHLDAAKVREAEQLLNERVMGQPAAVRAVADVLVNARVGVDFVAGDADASSRPKGVFFFVGPTGVGKTELAKALAELVFEDESAMRRFDMSEYGQEHASERLTGAPPGFVGHDQGGVLTNWVRERPFSVILFDEIEKAHPKIFDKFLQIIDDGRLTDGQGQTGYFSHSIVIFTSNQGAATLLRRHPGRTPPSYEAVQEHFTEAVRNLFNEQIQRPELLGRLGGGVVVFDILREGVIEKITGKFLRQITDSAHARGFELVVDAEAISRAVVSHVMTDGLVLGARPIRDPLLEKWVRIPLNRWILNHAPAPGTRIWVHADETSPPFAISEYSNKELS